MLVTRSVLILLRQKEEQEDRQGNGQQEGEAVAKTVSRDVARERDDLASRPRRLLFHEERYFSIEVEGLVIASDLTFYTSGILGPIKFH